jgi:hypothetical protein
MEVVTKQKFFIVYILQRNRFRGHLYENAFEQSFVMACCHKLPVCCVS